MRLKSALKYLSYLERAKYNGILTIKGTPTDELIKDWHKKIKKLIEKQNVLLNQIIILTNQQQNK